MSFLQPTRGVSLAGRRLQVAWLRSTATRSSSNNCNSNTTIPATTTGTTSHSESTTLPSSDSTTVRPFSSSSSNSDSARFFQTGSADRHHNSRALEHIRNTPGSLAFADMERDAVIDLFHQFAIPRGGKLDLQAIKELLRSIGEVPREITLQRLFDRADTNGDGAIDLEVGKYYCGVFLQNEEYTIDDALTRSLSLHCRNS